MLLKRWVLAAWKVGNIEEEGVIPQSWVNLLENTIWWPTQEKNSFRLLEKEVPPAESWQQFNIIKVKFSSDNKSDCEKFNDTSAEETDVSEIGISDVRKRKQKQMTDYVSDYSSGITENEHSHNFKLGLKLHTFHFINHLFS
ncbi:uncharacterized protein LOC144744884 [Ciona intestinalis]